jgi:hypothetical protein
MQAFELPHSADTVVGTAETLLKQPFELILTLGTVTAATDSVAATGHGLATGDGPVVITSSTGAIPAGLVAGQHYWVIAADANTLKLARTKADAVAGTAVDITDAGGGTLVLEGVRGKSRLFLLVEAASEFRVVVGDYVGKTFTADNLTEEFTAGAAHGLRTGDGPYKVSTSGALPAGLSSTTLYWIIRTGNATFKLATSRENALAGTAVAITTDGTGTQTLGGMAGVTPGATTADGYSSAYLAAPASDYRLIECAAPARLTVKGAGADDKLTYWWR